MGMNASHSLTISLPAVTRLESPSTMHSSKPAICVLTKLSSFFLGAFLFFSFFYLFMSTSFSILSFLSRLALPCLALSCLALLYLALPCCTLPCLALPCSLHCSLHCLALPCFALCCRYYVKFWSGRTFHSSVLFLVDMLSVVFVFVLSAPASFLGCLFILCLNLECNMKWVQLCVIVGSYKLH